ncbi:MAG: TIGR00266 family protein [Anaerolineaceae bacterium]|nr:MAG: TIGR00266 family protein [Anaerolineaceae bacterium]
MHVTIKYQPSYSMADVQLDPNEVVVAETGAMVGMSQDVHIETKMQGGLLKSLSRSVLGGESFFINNYRAGSRGGRIIFAPTLPGDIFTLDLLESQPFLVQSGSFLASAESVETNTKWGGAKTFFSGEGFIMLRCSGSGMLILSSYGAIHEMDLEAGEKFTIDTGHLVAFDEKINYNVRMVGGLKSTLLGEEGLVVDLQGPGKVLMQTRNVRAYLDWLIPHIPHEGEGKGLNINF